jgi:hypothetical protein
MKSCSILNQLLIFLLEPFYRFRNFVAVETSLLVEFVLELKVFAVKSCHFSSLVGVFESGFVQLGSDFFVFLRVDHYDGANVLDSLRGRCHLRLIQVHYFFSLPVWPIYDRIINHPVHCHTF